MFQYLTRLLWKFQVPPMKSPGMLIPTDENMVPPGSSIQSHAYSCFSPIYA